MTRKKRTPQGPSKPLAYDPLSHDTDPLPRHPHYLFFNVPEGTKPDELKVRFQSRFAKAPQDAIGAIILVKTPTRFGAGIGPGAPLSPGDWLEVTGPGVSFSMTVPEPPPLPAWENPPGVSIHELE